MPSRNGSSRCSGTHTGPKQSCKDRGRVSISGAGWRAPRRPCARVRVAHHGHGCSGRLWRSLGGRPARGPRQRDWLRARSVGVACRCCAFTQPKASGKPAGNAGACWRVAFPPSRAEGTKRAVTYPPALTTIQARESAKARPARWPPPDRSREPRATRRHARRGFPTGCRCKFSRALPERHDGGARLRIGNASDAMMSASSVLCALAEAGGALVEGPLPPELELLRADEPPQGAFAPLLDALRASLAIESQGKDYLAALEGARRGWHRGARGSSPFLLHPAPSRRRPAVGAAGAPGRAPGRRPGGGAGLAGACALQPAGRGPHAAHAAPPPARHLRVAARDAAAGRRRHHPRHAAGVPPPAAVGPGQRAAAGGAAARGAGQGGG
jgi:hypothetical protein